MSSGCEKEGFRGLGPVKMKRNEWKIEGREKMVIKVEKWDRV